MTSPLATLSDDTTPRHATPAGVSAVHALIYGRCQGRTRLFATVVWRRLRLPVIAQQFGSLLAR